MFEKQVTSFDFVLNNPSAIFYSGQTVDGKVILVVENDLKLREITLEFKGFAKVHWSEQHGSGKHRHTVHYSSNEIYFQQFTSLVPKGNDNYVFKPGKYEYIFTFQVPPNVPTSFETDIGRVRYMLTANIDRPWAFDTSTSCLLTLLTPFNLNTTPDASSRAENEDFKTLCCWCCESGPITGKISIERMGYVPGEVIMPQGEVVNNSNRKMKDIRILLIQRVEYITPRKTRECDFTAAEVSLGELDVGKPMSIHGARLVIPPIPPSGLVHCNIINVHYFVELKVVPSGMAFNLCVLVPSIIGTIPLQSTVQQYGAPAQTSLHTQSNAMYPPPPAVIMPSDIPPPSYAPSIFGPTQIAVDDDDSSSAKPASENAVGPTPSAPNTWTPSYSYYNWN